MDYQQSLAVSYSQNENSATWHQVQQPNIKKDNEFMGINLLLLDEPCSVIHTFIPSAYASQFRNVLREGVIFNFGGFKVGRWTRLCKIICFLSATKIVEVPDTSSRIRLKEMVSMLQRLPLLHHNPTVQRLPLHLPREHSNVFEKKDKLDNEEYRYGHGTAMLT
ncbi:PREDICTED: uncharacterized protein LOC104701162 [Camelina sativa]|uniref:Uncharacterized protein LOC104701162 n=1 Tax=Camelina sativa TaxID=90675 RepID=A0ABM0SRK1_CAMSA|nr:PREDICTED: uncharacterized protein LOC104701162 [Camelina sativa]